MDQEKFPKLEEATMEEEGRKDSVNPEVFLLEVLMRGVDT